MSTSLCVCCPSLVSSDRMKLKRIRNEKTEHIWEHEPLISCWAVGLCFDFHRSVSNVTLAQTHEPNLLLNE